MKIKGGHQAIFQMDTRVTCNVIRAGELRGTKYEPKVAQMNQVLKTYNSSPLRPVGKCLIQLTNLRNGKKYIVEFVVVKDNDADANLLGSMAAQQMNLIQPRRILEALTKPLKEHLTELEEQGVIEKVVEATDWVSATVVNKKSNGKIRLCLDPKPLNKALK
ncbi:hypothetical protein P5673_018727 [Acropora cervicornis]|uniref:Uncharacterized protein n=1 Tax=Acropora cervicornis TaxID=6130 RepID=A0AAD9V2U9_ACRCE|nr:hypothetical protein P5673_018727 [Acropora cervicornis]